MLNLNAFVVGLLFGLGLIISGMTDPSKVIGFLDLAGAWDPSLAFVMGGAILVGAGAFTIAKKRQRSLLGAPMQLSSATELDKGLLIGSLVFGIGWGLSGFCPGPAVVSAAAGQPKAWIFVASMLAGMALYIVIDRRGK
ncbi:YeeE/YedE family protein [Methylobacter sp.]|uniref:YeeE/YedE family protein n=1 Tax=Methylobacter sp. TaxID=2051955 RepID=UPI002486F3F0|nr:YeeE/YedE family protein [Methylobacter sp.]MDI1278274.1 YeeE/YedE family protein [Methylobacter sp.]MDI1359034.1 YeeE/YedE family protein [Methylobacter sp.]